MTNDNATPGANPPPAGAPKFPWDEGYVAPKAPASDNPYAVLPPMEVPTQAFHPSADPYLDESLHVTPVSDAEPILSPSPFRVTPDGHLDASSSPPPQQPYPTRSRRSSKPPPARPGSRSLVILGSIAGLLLVAIIVLLVIVLQPKATPVAAPTGATSSPPVAEEEPVEEEPVEEEPTAAGPTFDSFDAPESAGCTEGDTQVPIEFSWSSADAVRAYIGVATEDARAEAFDGDLPPTHTYNLIPFLCDQESQFYTITLEDAEGDLTHRTVVITR